ncbi:hypothetical protein ACWEPL_31680 [Nonomuraea sp. NPDC004186]
MNWTLTLEYLKVIIWPFVITVMTIVFRTPLKELVRRISRVGAAGAEVEFGPTEEVLQRADATIDAIESSITDAVIDESESHPSEDSPDSSGDDKNYPLSDLGKQSQMVETVRRNAIEAVLREGARLGWEWARSGEVERPPDLRITWNHAGYPEITQSLKKRVADRIPDSEYERQITNALQRVLPPGAQLIARYVAGRRVYDFVVTVNDRAIAVELISLLDSARNVAHMQSMYVNATRHLDNFTGLIIVTQEIPRSNLLDTAVELIGKEGSARLEIVRWRDPNDDFSLLQAIQRIGRLAADA